MRYNDIDRSDSCSSFKYGGIGRLPLCKWRAGLRLRAMHELYLGPFLVWTTLVIAALYFICVLLIELNVNVLLFRRMLNLVEHSLTDDNFPRPYTFRMTPFHIKS